MRLLSAVLLFATVTTHASAPRRACALQAPARGAVVIENVNVVPMDRERVLTAQTVVVERGVIAQIGSRARVTIPAGAQRVDGTGKYLTPGIVDLHVHLGYNPEDQQIAILKLFLANGVTTVLNLRGTPQVLSLRTSVAAGRVMGPTIYSAGPYINEPFFTTPDEVERAVVDQKRAGYDFIKLHGDLSREAYARLNATGRREGIRIIGHAPRNLGLAPMFEEKQYAVVHAEEYIYDTSNRSRDQDLPQVEAQIPANARSTAQAGIWLMPNLIGYKMIGVMIKDLDAFLARPEVSYLPRPVQQVWGPATNAYTTRFPKGSDVGIMRRHALLQKMTLAFHRAGVRMLVGTDAMNTGVVPGFSAHGEMAELVASGLTPFEALRAATSNAASFLAVTGQRGVVAVGQNADLLLLDANPLANIDNTRRIAGVMSRGQWLSRSDIAKMLSELR